MSNFKKLCLIAFTSLIIFGCGGGGGVSIKPVSDAFDESDMPINTDMDILWVVDPSRSMYDKVEKVRNNIEAFVTDFINNGYAYRMGVISTAAWSHEAYLNNNGLDYLLDNSDPLFARLHSGECVDHQNLVPPILDELSGDTVGNFMLRFQKVFDVYGVSIGTSGCGLVGPPFRSTYSTPPSGNLFSQEPPYDDTIRGLIANYIDEERPLQSMRAFLNLDSVKPGSDETKFLRDNAYLAVIIITDEPDSSEGTAQEYVQLLESIKGSRSKFGVYTIVDPAIANHKAAQVSTILGNPVLDINGSQQDYITNLNNIKNSILIEATSYPLQHDPVVNSIVVEIVRENGIVESVPRSQGGAPGFTYNSATQSITFSEEYLPTPKDSIVVNYTPASFIAGVSKEPRLDIDETDIEENSPNDTVIGTVTLRNGNAEYVGDFSYSIETDTSGGGFAIEETTGVLKVGNTSLLDADTQSRHKVNVKLTVTREDLTTKELTKEFLLRVIDVADSDPVANDDEYTVSMGNADPSGNIFVTGNVSYNDTGLDASEVHHFSVSSVPSVGNAQFQSNGVFTYNVNASELNFGSGNEVEVTFVYEISGTVATPPATTPASDTATVKITILRDNQNPIITNAIANQTVDYDTTEENLSFNAADVTSFHIEEGSIADLVDAGQSEGLTTRPGTEAGYLGTPYVELGFPAAKPNFEVLEFRIEGGHSLGNAVLQVLDSNDRVLTREIIGVDDGGGTNGSSLVIPVQRAVIGNKIRILRPQGSVNPQGDQFLNLRNVTVYGREAKSTQINLNLHFSDPDITSGDVHCSGPSDPRLDCLTYYITDEYGEGAAPPWATLSGDLHHLNLLPSVGADATIGVLAVDKLGATVFQKFRVQRVGEGNITNAAPISLLALDDAKRGGITLKRFGGGPAHGSDHQMDNMIRHGEGDNFLLNPYAGQVIRDALTAGGITDLRQRTYRNNTNNIPLATRNYLINNGHGDQIPHFGDEYDSWPENGWSIVPVETFDKYPLSASSYCTGSVTPNGRITPCINSTRSYGETYTAYFVPAKTGIYRFRSASAVDDLVRLLLAPTEYVEDLVPVITSHHTGVQDLANSLYAVTGDTYVANQEFSPNAHPAGGHDTSIFYEGPVVNNQGSYRKGYVYLKQGNVYALEIRFQEGGGDIQFSFEYDRKDKDCNPSNNQPNGTCWDGWAAIDASVVVPAEGSDAHTPMIISGSGLPFDAKDLFYDAEGDTLDYTARLVNQNGTPYGNGTVEQIGLSMGSTNGMLSGTLNQTFMDLPENQRPRIIFKAQERFTSAQAEVESLAIKIQP